MVDKKDTIEFKPQQLLTLTTQEQINLNHLKRFRMLEWFVEREVVKRGGEFGELALTATKPEFSRHQEKIVANQETVVAILHREEYLKIVKRHTVDVEKKKIEFIQSIPYFSSLSSYQSSVLLKRASEQAYCRNQLVF